jgi:hypothetical protein
MMTSGCSILHSALKNDAVPAAMTNKVPPPIARQGMDFADYMVQWNVQLGVCNGRLDAIRIYSGD